MVMVSYRDTVIVSVREMIRVTFWVRVRVRVGLGLDLQLCAELRSRLGLVLGLERKLGLWLRLGTGLR